MKIYYQDSTILYAVFSGNDELKSFPPQSGYIELPETGDKAFHESILRDLYVNAGGDPPKYTFDGDYFSGEFMIGDNEIVYASSRQSTIPGGVTTAPFSGQLIMSLAEDDTTTFMLYSGGTPTPWGLGKRLSYYEKHFLRQIDYYYINRLAELQAEADTSFVFAGYNEAINHDNFAGNEADYPLLNEASIQLGVSFNNIKNNVKSRYNNIIRGNPGASTSVEIEGFVSIYDRVRVRKQNVRAISEDAGNQVPPYTPDLAGEKLLVSNMQIEIDALTLDEPSVPTLF